MEPATYVEPDPELVRRYTAAYDEYMRLVMAGQDPSRDEIDEMQHQLGPVIDSINHDIEVKHGYPTGSRKSS